MEWEVDALAAAASLLYLPPGPATGTESHPTDNQRVKGTLESKPSKYQSRLQKACVWTKTERKIERSPCRPLLRAGALVASCTLLLQGLSLPQEFLLHAVLSS